MNLAYTTLQTEYQHMDAHLYSSFSLYTSSFPRSHISGLYISDFSVYCEGIHGMLSYQIFNIEQSHNKKKTWSRRMQVNLFPSHSRTGKKCNNCSYIFQPPNSFRWIENKRRARTEEEPASVHFSDSAVQSGGKVLVALLLLSAFAMKEEA